VPDPDAKLDVYRYINPSRPVAASGFHRRNPPFIAERTCAPNWATATTRGPLWASRRGRKSDSIASSLLVGPGRHDPACKRLALRRFGFITTNSITQKFSRRVLKSISWRRRTVVPRFCRSRPSMGQDGAEGLKKAQARIA
jgi:hypothetical protein